MENFINISNLKEVLYRINVKKHIPIEMTKKAFEEILNIKQESLRTLFMGSFLTSYMARTPSVDEIVGLLEVAFSIDGYNPFDREKISIENEKVITIVGSGKKGVKTINISTASALLAASMGVYVVKPGSMSTSSLTGSADFIEELGAKTSLTKQQSLEILKKCRFTFFKIENIIPKFDRLYNGNFYVPHTLSFGLAGLLCPVKTDVLLYGLAHPDVELSLDVLNRFGVENAMVNCSTDDGIHFIDEMGVYGYSKLIGSKKGIKGRLIKFNPVKQLKLKKYTSKDISQKETVEDNIRMVINVLRGKGDEAHENIVCINAANLLFLSDKAKDLKDGFNKAKEYIKTGNAINTLINFIKLTGGDLTIINKFLGEK